MNDRITLHDAMETPVWMMVWLSEPERNIDVTMTYADLKIIYDMVHQNADLQIFYDKQKEGDSNSKSNHRKDSRIA